MKINKLHLTVILFVVIFGGIGLSMGFDYWETKSNRIPIKYKDGDFAGSYDPLDIRGSYYFKDISSLFDIPIDDLQEAFNISDNDIKTFQCKSLGTIEYSREYEVGTKSIRVFVAMYKGMPITLDEVSPAYLPSSAANIIKQKGNPTLDQLQYLDKYTITE